MADREKVMDMLRGYDTAMLVTRSDDNLDARPMQVAAVEDDGRVWFFTDDRSRKIREITSDSHVLVVCQDERSSYLALQGLASVVENRERATRYWREPFRVWFPDGVDDPHLVLVAVEPHRAEYWDNRGTHKLRYLFEAATAYASRRRPEVDEGDQHGVASF